MSWRQQYEAACHAIQTGVAYVLEKNPSFGTPKHLRVGVNTAHCDHAALAQLLIRKGVLSEEEYLAAIVAGVEEEARKYEGEVSALYGARIKLL